MTPRAHAVGSLLRPPELRQAHQQFADGTLTAEEVDQAADRAVDENLALQDSLVDVVTDGEARRQLFQDSLGQAVSGIAAVPAADSGIVLRAALSPETYGNQDDVEVNTDERGYVGAALVSPLERATSLALREYRYLGSRTTKPVKVTFPSPSVVTLTYWSPTSSRAAYPTATDAMWAWGEILKGEIRDLVEAGCRHVQLDAPDLTFPIGDWSWTYEQAGFTREEFLRTAAAVIDDVAASAPEATTSLHLCRGNDQGRWHTSGGYADVIGLCRSIPHVSQVFLEFDSSRAGGFEPLAEVPDDKLVVLGLVSTKSPELESADELSSYVRQAARHHPLERLAVSPQCGFASVVAGNPLTPEVQADKLALVSEVAQRVWPG